MNFGRFGASVESYRPMNLILEGDQQTGGLYLGDYTAATDRNLLKQKGIKTVLTVASGLNISYPQQLGIVHKTYNILDIESSNILRILPETHNFILDGLKRGNVLVHCAAGVSRSATTVIAFIMREKGLSYNESFNFVKKKRYVICPNFGFQRQLRSYEKQIQQSLTQSNVIQMRNSDYFTKQDQNRPLTKGETRLYESDIQEQFSKTQAPSSSIKKVDIESNFSKSSVQPFRRTTYTSVRTASSSRFKEKQFGTQLPPFKNERTKVLSNFNMISTYGVSYGSSYQKFPIQYSSSVAPIENRVKNSYYTKFTKY